jgi:hypothetical protein
MKLIYLKKLENCKVLVCEGGISDEVYCSLLTGYVCIEAEK